MRRMYTTLLAAALLLPACELASHGAQGEAESSVIPTVPTATPASATVSAPVGDVQTLASVPDVAERVVKSVVNISSTHKVKMQQSPFMMDPLFQHFFGQGMPQMPRDQLASALGSGVIVRADGIVLTNNHVVDDADDIEVHLNDGQTLKAKVVGKDPKTDLAVIRLVNPPQDLVPLTFGDSDQLRLGQTVLAVGDPLGVGETVTMGIVSATKRTGLGIEDYEDFIQTDAAINPGNSGGALVNLQGQLVGINTAIMSQDGGYQGIGFAIPTSIAEGIMTQLLDHGSVDRGWLGVAIQDLNPALKQGLGVDVSKGVLVSDVVPDSPAQKAGFQRGDVITSFDGKALDSASDLRFNVASEGPDKAFTAQVVRDGKPVTLNGKLGKLTNQDEVASGEGSDSGATSNLDGLSVAPLDDAARNQLDLPARVQGGVLVQGVEPGSQAAMLGLRQGDVILQANRQAVSSVHDLEKALGQHKGQVLLLVWRDGATLFLATQG
jgi:serine protease Do